MCLLIADDAPEGSFAYAQAVDIQTGRIFSRPSIEEHPSSPPPPSPRLCINAELGFRLTWWHIGSRKTLSALAPEQLPLFSLVTGIISEGHPISRPSTRIPVCQIPPFCFIRWIIQYDTKTLIALNNFRTFQFSKLFNERSIVW